MPSAATQSPGSTASANRGGTSGQRPSVPFIRASAEHVEAPFFDQTFTLGANLQDFGVIEVPAYGYVRNVVVMVNASAITGGTGAYTFAEDSPFQALQNIQFNEPNGAQIVQVNDGYELYLTNKWSGYQGPGLSNDHRADPQYSQVATNGAGAFSFMLRIPVELDCRSGLGALPNQAANATFRVRAALAPISQIFVNGGANLPTGGTCRVRMFTETWDQPEVASGGVSNQVTPPAMNTTQFWSRQVYNLGGGGSQTVRLTRVGNYLRNNIFILRSGAAGVQGAGPRFNADNLWTSVTSTIGAATGISDGQVTFFIDSRPIQVLNDRYWKLRMWERSGGYGSMLANAPAAEDGTFGLGTANAQNLGDEPYGLDFGVRVLDWAHEFDNNYGRENRDLWQPTLGSTRFEIQSSFGALTNGTLTVLTNDVAIAGNVFLS